VSAGLGIILALVSVLAGAVGAGATTPSSGHGLTASERALVDETLFAASATQVAERHAADDAILTLHRQIDVLKAQGSKAVAALSAAQERYLTLLAQKDRAYAEQIAVFRSVVEDIASTPGGAAALAQYNAGDEDGALAVLDHLAEARQRAKQARTDIDAAADQRRIAALANDAHVKGSKVTTHQMITRYEAVTKLDPGLWSDWMALARLYQEAGRRGDAQETAQHAAETATADRDRAVALSELGALQANQGDLAGARTSYREGLAIFRALAKADPRSAAKQRDLSISLERLGDAQAARQDDMAGARASYQDELAITRILAKADPSSAEEQRDLSVSLERIAYVQVIQGDLAGARASYQESLDIRRALAKADPTSAEEQRDLSVTLARIGSVQVDQGDLAGGRAAYQEALAIRRALAKADPNSPAEQYVLGNTLETIGDVQVRLGDLAGARASYQEGLDLRRTLAKADPTLWANPSLLSVSLDKIGDVQAAQGDLAAARASYGEARDTLTALDRQGRLAPTDRSFLEEMRRKAEAPHP